MPPISEDCSSQGESEAGDEGDSNFEQLMVSMLEERDKLQENLRDTQDLLQNTIARLRDVEKEKNILQSQLEKTMPLVSCLSGQALKPNRGGSQWSFVFY